MNNCIRILQIDGGGVKGIIPAIICSEIESQLGRPIYEIFDLITGTSTGAVIGGALAIGMPASKLKQFYLNDVVELFKHPRTKWLPWNLLRSKYNINSFKQLLQAELGDTSVCDTKTKYMATTFNVCSQRTHFIKSWDETDRQWSLVDVISWSALSAVNYFGKINVPNYEWTYESPEGDKTKRQGAVFQDGGQGNNNSTLTFDLMECLANDYQNVFILSIGTGDHDVTVKYSNASKWGLIRQALNFLTQARNEAIPNQVAWAKYVDKSRGDDFTICRLNKTISKKQDKLDAHKYTDKYKEIGFELAKQIPFEKLAHYMIMQP
jgi:patatin-like phospholipase/acyl hydrolase